MPVASITRQRPRARQGFRGAGTGPRRTPAPSPPSARVARSCARPRACPSRPPRAPRPRSRWSRPCLSSTPSGSLLTNIATVAGDQTEPVPDPHANRDAAETLVVVPRKPVPPPAPTPLPDPDGSPQPPVSPERAPDIRPGPAGTRVLIHKTGTPSSVAVGGTIDYTLRVSNVGDAEALHVRVCDRTPAQLTLTSAPGFAPPGRRCAPRSRSSPWAPPRPSSSSPA